MNFLPPDSDLTDPHDEINDMRLRWDIRFSEVAGGRTVASSWPASVWALLAAALALALGAAGPWVTLGSVSESGLDQDGAIVLVASGALALAAVQAAWRRSVLAALACVVASVVTLAIAVADYRQVSGDHVGWGLQLVLMASLAAAAMSVRVLLEARRRPR